MDQDAPGCWPAMPAYAAACRAIAASGRDRCTVVDAGCGPYAHMGAVRGCLRDMGVSCRTIGIDEFCSTPNRADRVMLRLLSRTMRGGRGSPEWRSRHYDPYRSRMRGVPVLRSWFGRPFHTLCRDGSDPYDVFMHCRIQDADIGPVADAVILSYVTNPDDPEFGSIFGAAAAMCAPGGVVACSWITDNDGARVLTADEAAEHGRRCAGTYDCMHGLGNKVYGCGSRTLLRRAA